MVIFSLLNISRRNRNRIITFSVFILVSLLILLIEDFLLRIIAIFVLVIYAAFIIFLRDSVRSDEPYEPPVMDEEEDQFAPPSEHSVNTFDEGFEVVSKHTNIETINADNFNKISSPRLILNPPDLIEKFGKIINEEIPSDSGNNEMFSFVLENILKVIHESFYGTHTAVFFWYKKNESKLSIEKFVSVSNEISRRKFDIEDDILSKIVENGEPKYLTEIPSIAEADSIRYYSTVQGIKSFAGVPLFFEGNLIGILAIDSKSRDSYGPEHIYALGRIVRLISLLIGIFQEKHADHIAKQRLKGILNLINTDKNFENEFTILNSLESTMSLLIHWDAFAFVFFNPLLQKFKISKVVNKTSLKYVGENLEIELNNTLVGKSIITEKPVKIDDTSIDNLKRFSRNEDVNFEGSFMAVPLVYNNQNYGVICFESLKKNIYSNNDLQFLKSAVNILSFIIYSYSSQTLLKSFIALDIETKALNLETFREQLESDLLKCLEFKAHSTIALIKIDDFLEQESLFEGNPFPKVLQSIFASIKEELPKHSLIGRLDERVFGIFFFGVNSKDVFLWAEKLRIKIARKAIAVASRQTTYTVSIGIASSSGQTNTDEVIRNADLALQKAVERGGNAVRTIN